MRCPIREFHQISTSLCLSTPLCNKGCIEKRPRNRGRNNRRENMKKKKRAILSFSKSFERIFVVSPWWFSAVLIPRIPNECELRVMVNSILTNKCETSPLLPSPTSRRIKVVPKFLLDNESRDGTFREMADRILEFSHPPPRYLTINLAPFRSIPRTLAPVTRDYAVLIMQFILS